MKSTRERILQNILINPRATISELAQAVGINGISVRHHLTSLQAEGLITAEEERHGVGRPRLVYKLSKEGMERFPTRYFTLTNRLLDEIKSLLPDAVASQLFEQMAQKLAAEHAGQMRSLTLDQKLNMVQDLLADEGFTVEWEKTGNEYHIHEITCPYFQVAQSHPEVCAIDQSFISNLLSIPVEKIQCVLRGDAHCTYVIVDSNPSEVSV